jgi:hypothetical protein
MAKRPAVFLSYTREDDRLANALEKELKELELEIWRDVRSIVAGQRWVDSVEKSIRQARAVVVLITDTSAKSDWVTYEYAFASGAGIPVVAVAAFGVRLPIALRHFQMVQYSTAAAAAAKVNEGIQEQSRSRALERGLTPQLMARFQEENGEIVTFSEESKPSFGIDLWVEHAPKETRKIAFEILDRGFDDRKWTITRRKKKSDVREFLTDEDMNSWGDVEIWIRGIGTGHGAWSTKSRLHEALIRYYSAHQTNAEVRRALKQIREY